MSTNNAVAVAELKNIADQVATLGEPILPRTAEEVGKVGARYSDGTAVTLSHRKRGAGAAITISGPVVGGRRVHLEVGPAAFRDNLKSVARLLGRGATSLLGFRTI
jgi:hypothetical protein